MCSILSSKLGWLNKVQPKTTILDMPSFEYQPLLELEDNNKESSLKESNTSFLKTVFNGINVILGNGILIVPYALAHGGWLSLILFIAIAAVATYTSLLLKWCMDVDPRIRTYSHIGEYAFGNAVGVFGIPIDGKSCFIVIVALILLPTVLLDSLSILAYISAVGVLASLLILGSVLWVGVFEGIIGFHQVKDHVPLFNWKGIPTAISLYMFCFSGQTVIPTVYISMQKKHHFSTALLLSFTFSAFVYVSMAVLGCLMFGSSVESQITLNLPTRKLSSEVAIYTTLITPLVKYALILKPVVVSTEGWFPSKYHNGRWFKYIVRLTLVATQVVIALALPFFGYLMSLMGALLCSVAALTIPCLCYLKISSTTSKSRPAERFFIWCIVCLSLVLLISGTYTSILDILVEITQ
ncbi:amino acid transporter AVT1I-like isoform X2 [Chenopodium quinoa]|uniref:amino acid transporter AVT1I-like isoform X2 n=1 Tax=Chenopodium quinoa TaxID=63459 RepID=UPI000B78A908|nr:amino acid transporter AVT1I-like isoform X2 [Chenopodium quinoa]